MTYKLGKLPAKFDGRTLKLSAYLDVPALPPLPAESNWLPKVSKFNMGGNDRYGDCVICGAAHMHQVWTANAGKEVIIPDKTIIDTYFKFTGGVDSGLNLLPTLKTWRSKGMFGDKIAAFVSVNPKKITQMQYACWLFGGVYLGLDMPEAWQGANKWDVGPFGPYLKWEAGTWGGHCVNVVETNAEGYIVSTWGSTMPLTAAAMAMYADEAYAILTLDWFDKTHTSPSGFKWRDLQADLAEVTK